MSEATAAGSKLWIEVLNPDGRGTTRVEMIGVPGDSAYRCTLRAMPGADSVHVPVHDEQGLRFRCEIPATAGSPVDLSLIPDGDAGWVVASGSPRVRLLPAEAAEPLAPIAGADAPRECETRTAGNGPASWEVVLVIDGTMRWFEPNAKEVADRSGLLLEHPQRWGNLRDRLIHLLQALEVGAGRGGVALAVLAFGDHPIPGVDAPGLRPRYDVWVPPDPSGLRLLPFSAEGAAALLGQIQATPGGDFVDALADALARCRDLPWSRSPIVRKLLVLVGDSPGHSIAYPVAASGDALVRNADVDLEAAELHRKGVEILTLYSPPPPDLELFATDKARALIRDAAEQYRRLASAPDYALTLPDFEPGALAERLRDRRYPLGRGAGFGMLDGIVRGADSVAFER